MFQALISLLEQVDLTLHLHLEDNGDIRVVAVPNRTSNDDDASLFTPLSLTGSPVELDDYFPVAVNEFSETRKSLSDQLKEAKDAAKKAVEEARAAQAKKAADAKKPATGKAAPTGARASAAAPTTSTPATSTPAAGTPAAGVTAPRTTVAASGAGASSSVAAAGETKSSSRVTSPKNATATNGAAIAITDPAYFTAKSNPDLQQLIRELLPTRLHTTLVYRNKPDMAAGLASHFEQAFRNDGSLDGSTVAKLRKYAADNNALPQAPGLQDPGSQDPGSQGSSAQVPVLQNTSAPAAIDPPAEHSTRELQAEPADPEGTDSNQPAGAPPSEDGGDEDHGDTDTAPEGAHSDSEPAAAAAAPQAA